MEDLSCSIEFAFFCPQGISVLSELTLTSQVFSTATLAPVSQLKHTGLAALGESLLSVGHPSKEKSCCTSRIICCLGDQAGNPLPRKKFTLPWFSAGKAPCTEHQTAGLGLKRISTSVASAKVHLGTNDSKRGQEKGCKKDGKASSLNLYKRQDN